MRALVAGGPDGLQLTDIDPPQRQTDEALVAVEAVSLNRGEAMGLADESPGARLGWDFAGKVLESPDRMLAVGTRVLGLVSEGGWAEQVALPITHLGRVPAELDLPLAAALPVAGLTAQRTLRAAGPLGERSVLVTGASGAVGRLAVQLAALEGARVIAVVSRPEQVEQALALGADVAITDVAAAPGRMDVVLESVGGKSLTGALEILAVDGVLITFGTSSVEPARIPPFWFGSHAMARMQGFVVFADTSRHAPADDLTALAAFAGSGRLDPGVSRESSWYEAADVIRALLERRIEGKAVLRVH